MDNHILENDLQIKPRNKWPRRFVFWLILAVVVVGGMLAFPRKVTRPETTLADPQLIEELYGIRIKWVAVIAGGGGIDFRFIVVNPDKANELLHDPNFRPILNPNNSGKRINPPEMTHNFVFQAGIAYHILFSNPGGIVERGTPVTVEFGDHHLAPIIAQ
jgi:hypothetical protein